MKTSTFMGTSVLAGFGRPLAHDYVRRAWLWAGLVAALNLTLVGRVMAQTFTNLYSFTDFDLNSFGTNSDGGFPKAGLLLSGNRLFGTAEQGGDLGYGTVFAINTDATGFTNLHSFRYRYGNEGAYPDCGLVLLGDTLYGTTGGGGSSTAGTVFAVKTNGTGFTNLYSFTGGTDGGNPYTGLVLGGNTLYGTANYGGISNFGCVFAVKTDGTGFTNLHSFTGTDVYHRPASDGSKPFAGLILSGSALFGTTSVGGSWGRGMVFAVSTNGIYVKLHDFTDGSYNSAGYFSNSDGALPDAGLVLSGDILYGTTSQGGSSGRGTVFAIPAIGTAYGASATTLHSFAATDFNTGTNSDGAGPAAGLMLSGTTLYGTTYQGGRWGEGTIFAVSTDGTGFTNLYSFMPKVPVNGGGSAPLGGLILAGNTLYGTAGYGGLRKGTVFGLSLGPVSRPQLIISPSGANVVLTWPANAAGFTLQSTASVAAPAAWTNVLPAAVVVNGQNTVTNPISGTHQFYRLSQ